MDYITYAVLLALGFDGDEISPGASFMYAKLEQNNVDQLRRWLSGRGIKRSGNKTALLER